ncbi:unnamed protein product [Rhizophagus irregularis]|nr:unnamed protein product [Rhizophagus irregularis]
MSTLIGHDETEMDPIVNLELTIPIIDDDDKKTDYEISLSSEKKKSANLPPVRTPNTVWQHYEKVDDNGVHVYTKCSIEAAFNNASNAQSQAEDHADILDKLVNWVIDDCQPFKVILVLPIWFLLLTAYWINNEWNLKHAIIAFQRFPHPHTGLQIQKAIYKIFQDFSITTKALAITIDNGANQVAAMRLLSTTLSDELQIDFKIIRCGAHSIALVVNAGLEKFKPIIDKVRAFIIEVCKSPKKEQELITFATNLNVKYKKLIRDVKTRWNSTFLMLESFLNNKAVIVSLISIGSNFAKLDLNDDEWKELQLFYHLLEHITIIKNDTSIPKWIKGIAKEMQEKFRCISVNLYNSTATLALVLDPRYKTQILPNSVSVEDAKQLLLEKFNS